MNSVSCRILLSGSFSLMFYYDISDPRSNFKIEWIFYPPKPVAVDWGLTKGANGIIFNTVCQLMRVKEI